MVSKRYEMKHIMTAANGNRVLCNNREHFDEESCYYGIDIGSGYCEINLKFLYFSKQRGEP